MTSVLITGTSKGIGSEAALAFGRAGHKVHATMRKPSQSPELAEIAAREKLSITVSAMDVDSDESVRQAIAAIQQDHGPIDVLVNNAGIERSGSVEELPLADFRAVMETNYFGVIRCVQAVAPQMRKRRSGCVINVSSVAGRITCSPLSSYTASKWALEAFSEALAGEMKMFNVRVAIVEPGMIRKWRAASELLRHLRLTHSRRACLLFSVLHSRTRYRPRWSHTRSWKSPRVDRGGSVTSWAPTQLPSCSGVIK